MYAGLGEVVSVGNFDEEQIICKVHPYGGITFENKCLFGIRKDGFVRRSSQESVSAMTLSMPGMKCIYILNVQFN